MSAQPIEPEFQPAPGNVIKLPTVFDIVGDMLPLQQALLSEDDEESRKYIEENLADLGEMFADKAESLALIQQNLEALAEKKKEHAKALAASAAMYQRRADALKCLLRDVMGSIGLSKIEGERITLSRYLAGANAQPFEPEPNEEVPEAFVRVTREWNRKALTAALKAGEHAECDASPYAQLFRSPVLRITTR